MKMAGRIHIGTSGWHYAHWRGPFYPEGMPPSRFLGFYSRRFLTVEINNSFYRLPEEKTLLGWKNAVPEGFVFSVKASRLITHLKRLKDPGAALPNFMGRVDTLKDKLGPVLFQLPPRFKPDPRRLGEFLKALPAGHRYAFEFRDPAWFDDDVYGLLSRHNAAFCVYDLEYELSPLMLTADFAYVRLHGPDGRYRGQYSGKALAGWARTFSAWMGKVGEIYCYFDNDEAGYAAQDAMRLIGMVEGMKAPAR